MNSKRLWLLRRLYGPLLIVVALTLLSSQLQAITDWYRLYNYQAPPAISGLADQTTMTPLARKMFYLNHPEIDNRDAFNKSCASDGEQTIVLGCYHGLEKGIFLFSIQDRRLDGVEQVTAAHEMLHAAYDRLDQKQRATIDRELQDFYSHVTDKRIRSTMAAYQVSEPNDVPNEMHSIFGTEIAALTPQLETYYKRYFTDRSKVVQYADAYHSQFTSRTDKVKAYDTQLAHQKDIIEANTASLHQQLSALDDMKTQMDAYRAGGDTRGYNALVPIYNAKVESYNNLVRTTQQDIASYNSLVAERNSLALQIQQLTQSISSQPTTIGR